MKRPLGCLTGSGLLTGGITLILILGFTWMRGGGLFSPGGLNAQTSGLTLKGVKSHADLSQNCGACHTAFWTSAKMADRCTACHTDLTQDPKNFHSLMLTESQKAGGCQKCHTDHHGPTGALTIAGLDSFPHNTTGFSLQSHQKNFDGKPFACSGCHGSTFIHYAVADCNTCHAKAKADFMKDHNAAFGLECLTCHDGVDAYGHAFSHQTVAFALDGKHATTPCAGCHQATPTIAGLKATPQTCYACHAKDDTHQGQLGQDCGACHNPANWTQATFDHSKTTFPLVGKHQAVDCTGCHTDKVFKGTPTQCYACHAKDDSHNGTLGQDCGSCHTPIDWNQITFDHSKASFPLTGKHLGLPCQDCHTNSDLKATPQSCGACHAKDDTHKGQLGQDCSLCHTTSGWLPSTFDHSKTSFPLTGAHLNVDCSKCHAAGANGPVFKGTPTACVACHADPAYHAGMFGTACATCHNTSAWIPAVFNRAHTFPIHHGGAATCRSCHPNTLSGWTCYFCHNATQIANRHISEGISNFSNCLKCHPTGGGGDGGGGGG